MLNNLLQMHLKLLQKEQFKTEGAAGDLIGYKISNEIAKNLLQNDSDTDSKTKK